MPAEFCPDIGQPFHSMCIRDRHVHLKDVRLPIRDQACKEGWSFLQAVKNGVFTVPGDGDVDFAPIFDVLAENSYEGWVVVEAEQDPAKANPFELSLIHIYGNTLGPFPGIQGQMVVYIACAAFMLQFAQHPLRYFQVIRLHNIPPFVMDGS